MTPRSRVGRVPFLAAAFAALTLAACSSAEIARYHRFTDDSYLQREEPAVIIPGPPRDLSNDGYVLLGHVEVRQPVRECDGPRCWDYTHERNGRQSAPNATPVPDVPPGWPSPCARCAGSAFPLTLIN